MNIAFLFLNNLLQCQSLILNIPQKENNSHCSQVIFIRDTKKLKKLNHFLCYERTTMPKKLKGAVVRAQSLEITKYPGTLFSLKVKMFSFGGILSC